MLDDLGAVVIDSSKEKNEQLKKKWTKINKSSSEVSKLASSGFIVSILSPFEFDGPIIEIVTSVVAVVAFITKKVSEHKLNKLSDEQSELIDSDDKETLTTIASNLKTVVSNKKR